MPHPLHRADLDAPNPTDPDPYAPMECDGTGYPTTTQCDNTDDFLVPITLDITATWEVVNYWPWLVLAFVDESLDLILRIDILGSIQCDTLIISIPTIIAMSQAELDSTANQVNDYAKLIFSFTLPFIIGQMLVRGLRLLENMSWDVPKMVAGITAWLILFELYVTILDNLVLDGQLHPWGVAFNFLGFALALLPGLYSALSLAGTLVAVLKMHRLCDSLEAEYRGNNVKSAIWTTAIAFVKLFVLASCLVVYVQMINRGFSM